MKTIRKQLTKDKKTMKITITADSFQRSILQEALFTERMRLQDEIERRKTNPDKRKGYWTINQELDRLENRLAEVFKLLDQLRGEQ